MYESIQLSLVEKRRKAITLFQQGMIITAISKEVNLSRKTVKKVIELYNEGGEKALEIAPRGNKVGQGRAMPPEMEITIFNQICNQQPWQNKINVEDKRIWHHTLWDRNLLNLLVAQIAGVDLSKRSSATYAERWGFKLPDSQKTPSERCSKTVQTWLDDHYAEIEQRAKDEKARLVWLNKIKLAHIVPSKPKKKLWMVYITNQRGKLQWLVVKDAFNANRQLIVLKALARFDRRKVYVILEDNSLFNAHHVDNWLEANKEQIEVFPPLQQP